MQVTLVVQKGPALTRAIRLTAGETIVGRSRDCDLCIPSSDISRRHCLIALTNGEVTVEDLSSANGTFLNGVRISGTRKVGANDQLRIGPLTFTLKFEGTQLNMPPVSAAKPVAPAAKSAAPAAKPEVSTKTPDVIPLVDTDLLPTAPTPPPSKTAPPSKTPAKPEPAKKQQPAASAPDDDDDAVNLDDITWDLPTGRSFRDILDDMKE
jgi:pSer/pThr/pTyr-binding forkhead associated (FHA) protein